MAYPQNFKIEATGSVEVAQAKYGVTGAAAQIATASSERRTLRLSNEGSTYLWLGASSNLTHGASGSNFGSLADGSNTEVEHYRGPVWAIAGAGLSVAPVWVGVADIG